MIWRRVGEGWWGARQESAIADAVEDGCATLSEVAPSQRGYRVPSLEVTRPRLLTDQCAMLIVSCSALGPAWRAAGRCLRLRFWSSPDCSTRHVELTNLYDERMSDYMFLLGGLVTTCSERC